jgi:hypothetical protein
MPAHVPRAVRVAGPATDPAVAKAKYEEYVQEHPDTTKTWDDPTFYKKPDPNERPTVYDDLPEDVAQEVADADEDQRALVEDTTRRNNWLDRLADGVKARSKELTHRVVDAAKEALDEFKTAGKAVGKVVRGEKLEKDDKKALFAVGLQAAQAGLAVATGAGAVALAGSVAGNILKGVAVKAVLGAMGDRLNLLGDVGEVVQGVSQLLKTGSDEEPTDDEVLEAWAQLLVASLHRELRQGLSEKEVVRALRHRHEYQKPRAASLRSRTVRLAYARPDLRPVLLLALTGPSR